MSGALKGLGPEARLGQTLTELGGPILDFVRFSHFLA